MPEYSVFGLRVHSEWALPELPQDPGQAEPDVTIRFGTIDSECRDAGLHRLDDGILFVAPDAARYRITGGSEILVEPFPAAHDRNVRLYLMGSAFGAVIHQRGLLPLHANAVEIGGQAFAFMGAQGEGKSTLAAWFHDQGHRIIADDICVIAFRDEQPIALPGLPRLRLWEDALVHSGRASKEYERSFEGADDWNKFDVPIGPDLLSRHPLPFAGAYLLETEDEFSITQLGGLEAAETVFEHTYRGAYVDIADRQESHWTTSVKVVRTVPIFRLARERGLGILGAQAEQIRRHAQSVAGQAGHG